MRKFYQLTCVNIGGSLKELPDKLVDIGVE